VTIEDRIASAGVVGAGGAGFPAHVKAASHVDTVIANGAECEPLIHKDYELMVQHADRIVHGVKLLMESTGAARGIIGVKEKNRTAVAALTRTVDANAISLQLLGDFYPSGDEYVLVYESTRRLIPPKGFPPQVGVVVSNVETLYNISRAAEGLPVTEKFLTVAGAVKHPVSFAAPVGMSYRDAIAFAGGASCGEFALFSGGIMMGTLGFDLELPITKTTAGLIVLPAGHALVRRKHLPETAMHHIGKSACDQCTFCTELCPRYLLGYDIQPHKVMRSLGFTSTGAEFWNHYAELCCACGLCTLYACPESLFPKEACDAAKLSLKSAGVPAAQGHDPTPHPMYEGRRTPLAQLIRRLGIAEYDRSTEFVAQGPRVTRVEIMLKQHAGAPAIAAVRPGERVAKGDCIGEPPPGVLGARVHASIGGVVRSVGASIIIDQE
jgi:Na+-translocating ferredoxin:NAD+ oxidoreductase RnfC subunit